MARFLLLSVLLCLSYFAIFANGRGVISPNHEGTEISELLLVIQEKFLTDCAIHLFVDPKEWNKVEKYLGHSLVPLTIFSLNDSSNGGLELNADLRLKPHRSCSSYIFVATSAKGLQHLVMTKAYSDVLLSLGLYIFITEEDIAVAKEVLDNEVMAWRPHAVLVTPYKKGTGKSAVKLDYKIWTHHVFRDHLPEKVYSLALWVDKKLALRSSFFPDKLANFDGSELIAVTFEHAPSIMDAHGANGRRYDGIDIRLLYILSEALNFKLKIVNPSDGEKWGSPLDDGSWTGLTGDLTRRKAHMGVANLFIHIHYLAVVDMTIEYDMEAGCFITPLPKELPQWVALIYPFQEKDARSNVTRSFFLMWLWFGFLMTVVYRSSLTAYLTVPLTSPPIDTLEQLIASDLKAWGATGLTFKKMLEENPDPMVQKLAERYVPVSGAEEGILFTAQRKYAMMENRQYLEYTIATTYTNKYGEETLHVMRECFLPFRIGLAMPKKSPYKPNFDRVVRKVVESGLVRKWFKDILFSSRKRGSEAEKERDTSSLSVFNLEAAWLIIGTMLLASIVAFITEYFLKWKKI